MPELARRVRAHAHRVRGQAGLDRGLEVGHALDLLDLGAQVGGDLVEHGRIRAQDRDEDRAVAERHRDARQAFEALADLVLDLELVELALVARLQADADVGGVVAVVAADLGGQRIDLGHRADDGLDLLHLLVGALPGWCPPAS